MSVDAVEAEKPMTVPEAARYLRIHEQTMYKYMRCGTIPKRCIHRLGRNVYFFQSELTEFLKRS